jgi:hypothetical protein
MNLTRANEIRASLGLAPVAGPDAVAVQAQKRRQAANKAARAQESRDLKAKRGSRSK